MGQALYRVYRPVNFDEVVGQQPITTVLKNEMRAQKPAHAYLFVGSRGTGKTTCAKLVAKAANCTHLQDGNPCNECDICRGVNDGSLTDVVEIDAASNNGVDNIRDLRDEAVFTPAIAKYRVYIIDEVHMLSVSAFNALLKILEEPPEHVIFVLATTELHKVLPTIVSRCQRFDFQRIESGVIADRLLEVAKREGFSLEQQAALLIARLSDGGLRDALSLLDVCVANEREVTLQTVTRAAGLAGSAHLLALAQSILDCDAAAVLQTLGALSQKGMQPQRLCEQLGGHFRDLMLTKTLREPQKLTNCLPDELPALQKQAAAVELSTLLGVLSALQQAAVRMSKSLTKRAELELALVQLCSGVAAPTAAALAVTAPPPRGNAQEMAALRARVEQLERRLMTAQQAAATPAAQQSAPPPPPATGSREEPPPPPEPDFEPPPEEPPPAASQEFPKTAQPPAQKQGRTQPAPAAASKPPGEAVPFAQWTQVLERLRGLNPSIYGMLQTTSAYYNGRQVLIDVSNPVVLDMLRQNEYTKTSIKQAVFDVTGERCGLGPYRQPAAEAPKRDPLQDLIEALPPSDSITIE